MRRCRIARLMLVLMLALAGLAVCATGWVVVRPGERVVVRRFGRRLTPDWEPGFHVGLPLGCDRFDRVRTDQVRQLAVGAAADPSALLDPADGEYLTGDLNLVRAGAVIHYRVSDAGDHVVRSVDAERLLGRIAESKLSGTLARRGIDPVLRVDRGRIGAEVEDELRKESARLGLGLEILGVSLTEARPPAEVASDFSAAQSAESERLKRGHEARSRAEGLTTAGRASAQARLDAARAAAQRRVVTARAQAARFLALLDAAGPSRALTVRRTYLETMRTLLGRVGRKIVLPEGDAIDLTVLGTGD